MSAVTARPGARDPEAGGGGRPRGLSATAAAIVAAVALSIASSAAWSKEEVAVLETPLGEIAWRFFPKDAPGHVAYVKELIESGFYDGTLFHRVIPHFVIQGGDPLSTNADRWDDGEGEGDRRLKAEFSDRLHYRPGTVGMARDADPDSGSCQFFIALENIPRLDGRYTIFGEVVSGLDVARRIADLPRDLNDNPLEPVPVRARLEKREVPKEILSQEAGPSGEVLTGPGKPVPYDSRNVLWSAPSIRPGSVPPAGDLPLLRLEVAVGEDGRVIDVRFPDEKAPRAAEHLARAKSFAFDPVLYEGAPRKTRFEIESSGGSMGPSMGGGAPIDARSIMFPPRAAVRVDLPAGRAAPASTTRLRLTVDSLGGVADVAIQETCGDAALDQEAAAAAKRLLFTPAKRANTHKNDLEPIAAYVDVEARFIPASP